LIFALLHFCIFHSWLFFWCFLLDENIWLIDLPRTFENQNTLIVKHSDLREFSTSFVLSFVNTLSNISYQRRTFILNLSLGPIRIGKETVFQFSHIHATWKIFNQRTDLKINKTSKQESHQEYFCFLDEQVYFNQ